MAMCYTIRVLGCTSNHFRLSADLGRAEPVNGHLSGDNKCTVEAAPLPACPCFSLWGGHRLIFCLPPVASWVSSGGLLAISPCVSLQGRVWWAPLGWAHDARTFFPLGHTVKQATLLKASFPNDQFTKNGQFTEWLLAKIFSPTFFTRASPQPLHYRSVRSAV